jgi:prepilin-type processing-associated H-X9-DG protein
VTVIHADTVYTGPYVRWQDPSGTTCAGPQGIVTWGCLSLRHMNGSNATFADGHAAWYNYNSMRGDVTAGRVKWTSPH